MGGYVGQMGRPGMRGDAYPATGFAFLARDTTALEENDRGWENLPPWGYARNRPIDNAPPGAKGPVAGLGSCCSACSTGKGGCMGGLGGEPGGVVEGNAVEAANAYVEAILSATDTSLESPKAPDFAKGDAFLAQVEDEFVAGSIRRYAEHAAYALSKSREAGGGAWAPSVDADVANLRAIAAGGWPERLSPPEFMEPAPSGRSVVKYAVVGAAAYALARALGVIR